MMSVLQARLGSARARQWVRGHVFIWRERVQAVGLELRVQLASLGGEERHLVGLDVNLDVGCL